MNMKALLVKVVPWLGGVALVLAILDLVLGGVFYAEYQSNNVAVTQRLGKAEKEVAEHTRLISEINQTINGLTKRVEANETFVKQAKQAEASALQKAQEKAAELKQALENMEKSRDTELGLRKIAEKAAKDAREEVDRVKKNAEADLQIVSEEAYNELMGQVAAAETKAKEAEDAIKARVELEQKVRDLANQLKAANKAKAQAEAATLAAEAEAKQAKAELAEAQQAKTKAETSATIYAKALAEAQQAKAQAEADAAAETAEAECQARFPRLRGWWRN